MNAEIGIVGAGPAGARAAELLARRGVEVMMWDARAPWEKPCGGGLAASVLDLMPELGGVLDRARRIDAVRFENEDGRGFSVHLERPMYMVSRHDLSRFQLDLALGAGVSFIQEGIKRISRLGPGWLLEGQSGKSWQVLRLVGADGAASSVRKAVSPEFRVELAPTRVTYPLGAVSDPGTILVRLFDDVHGYLWDFSRSDHRSVGAGVEPGCWNREQLDRTIDGHLILGGGGWHQGGGGWHQAQTGAVIATAALGHGNYSAVGSTDFALLGDAAGFADPATGEGIQNALRSAACLEAAFIERGDFRTYSIRVRAEMDREFRIARLMRGLFFGAGAGRWLVRRGRKWRWARSTVSAVMNATNEHDRGLSSLLRRMMGGFKEERRV